ncbi:MAG: tetratricopeptide repeat protein, partial [Bacteroidota bacterium]
RIPPLRWIAAMAVVVVLAVGLGLWSSDRGDTVPKRIELTEMIAPDIYRDSQRGYDEKDVLINEGLAQAFREKPDDAIGIYRELLGRELTGAQEDAVRINLSILYYNSGAFEKAQSELNRLLNDVRADRPERLTGKSWWILGMSQVKLAKPEEAKHSFEESLKYDQIHEVQIREWIRNVR